MGNHLLQDSNIRESVMVPRAGFEHATTDRIILSFSGYDDFLTDLEDFKLCCSSKLNLSKGTIYDYSSRMRTFMHEKTRVCEKDIQLYIEKKKQECTQDYVTNIISAFKAYFRDYKGLRIMDGYKQAQPTLRIKKEIDPKEVSAFINSIDNLTVKCAALLLASSGLRKNEVLGLRKSDLDRVNRCIVPNCHTGETKHSGISFYNSEAEDNLIEYEKSCVNNKDKLFVIGHEGFLKAWNKARKATGSNLKVKDLRDFFSQEMGKALIPDRYIDIFQGRAPRGILAKHYTPQGIRLLKEIYDKGNIKILRRQ